MIFRAPSIFSHGSPFGAFFFESDFFFALLVFLQTHFAPLKFAKYFRTGRNACSFEKSLNFRESLYSQNRTFEPTHEIMTEIHKMAKIRMKIRKLNRNFPRS